MSLFAAIQFGSIAMLGWLVAAILPWLIHRLFRRHHHTMPWAAVQLLITAVQQQARRIYFQQWLLLAIRTAVIGLVVLAMANPAWLFDNSEQTNRDVDHLVLVIDQSYSMDCLDENGTRLDQAKRYARELIKNSHCKIFSIVSWTHQTDLVLGRPTDSISQALATVDNLQQSHSTANLSEASQAVNNAIDRAEQDWPQYNRHRIVFLSDQTETTWALTEREQSALTTLTEQASLELIDVSTQQPSNIAVVSITSDSEVFIRQQEVQFIATVQSFGASNSSEYMLGFKVEGQLVESKKIKVPANSTVNVSFTYRFANTGRFPIQVALMNANDALPIDNQRWLVADVQPQLRVACIEGFSQSAEDIVRALVPRDSLTQGRNSIKVEKYTVSQLSEVDLLQFDAILLCSVPALTQKEQKQLMYYVQQGGGLGIFLGAQAAFTGELAKILPAEIGLVVEADSIFINPPVNQHPVTSLFLGQPNSGFQQVLVSKYRELIPQSNQEIATILEFSDSKPALIVSKYKLGHIAILALPASLATPETSSQPWSSFPISPSFLPLIRELVNHLVGNQFHNQENTVGQFAAVSWPTSRKPTPIQVRYPDGKQLQLPTPRVESRDQVVLPDTPLDGVYTFYSDGTEFAMLAINLDSRESNLSQVASGLLPVDLSPEKSTLLSVQALRVPKQNLAQVLMLFVIILLLSESTIACWQGRAWQ